MRLSCSEKYPQRLAEYACQLVKHKTDEALEQNPAFYNEKSPEFLRAQKLTNALCWKFRWFLDEN